MFRFACLMALASALLACSSAWASDPIGGYMIVDKVILAPSDSPTTIQIWGSFALATKPRGKAYGNPERGYLYYKAPTGKEEVCRKEWNDLKKAAGTSQVIGFGSSDDPKVMGTIRIGKENRSAADVYPLDNGLIKIPADSQSPPIRHLVALPAPQTPGEGDSVPAGEVTLVVRNMMDKEHAKAKYIFEVESASGGKETATVEAGEKETRWTPKLKVKAGEKYTWRVRAVEGTWKGPMASTRFVVKGEK